MPEGLINVNGENVQALEILFLMTAITLLPSLVVMMTSFTRFIISFSFLRNAMGTQQTPPNIVLVGLALFLTFYTMSPTITRIQEEAYEPYAAEEIGQEEFLERAVVPLSELWCETHGPTPWRCSATWPMWRCRRRSTPRRWWRRFPCGSLYPPL